MSVTGRLVGRANTLAHFKLDLLAAWRRVFPEGPLTLERLAAHTLVPIHGDLHFDNILIDAYLPHDPIFVLIDPKGGGRGDPAYDIGKLLFSCEAGYDFVYEQFVDVNIRPETDHSFFVNVEIPADQIVHKIIRGGRSSAGLVSAGNALPRGTEEVYRSVGPVIRMTAHELACTKLEDQDLLHRADFYKGLFCVLSAQGQYADNPKGALGLMLRGCRFLDEWYAEGGDKFA